jgi:DAK2 domain fusion protein YloV
MTGLQFRDAVISGAATLTSHRQGVDELNVFPVPDGDTGTNMSLTINNAARVIERMNDQSVSAVAKETASALLRGARGNSGVILSLFFRGIAKGLKDVDVADGAQLAVAFNTGVDTAYKAVMKPTEGTILTVARLSAKAAEEAATENNDVAFVMEKTYEAAKEALAQTPELLPVLKKAGVVDAGGQGIVYIFEGMLSVLRDGVIVAPKEKERTPQPATAPKAGADFEEEINFTYCTEFIVQKDKSVDRDPIKLRAFLETIGDCVVVVDDDDIIKVHVHSDNPGKAIQEGIKFGMLTNIKIDNMRDQNQKILDSKNAPAKTAKGEAIAPAKPEKPFGFVTVAAGEGLCQLFYDLGADQLVEGGQTMNPSTDDILRMVEATPAETVFVLPNNKNIIMAAEQAIPLATRKVCVLPTRTIPQGISAMLAFDEDASTEDNLIAMTKAAENTGTGQITYAARNSNYDGKEIKEGEILALKEGKIAFVEQDMIKAMGKLTKAMVTKDSCQITLITGADVDEDTIAQATAAVEARAMDAEVTVIDGGQPVYYFILSVE